MTVVRPSGTVTFLFTDIESSTQLAQALGAGWAVAQARHHAVLRHAIETHGGYIFQVVGDAFCAAFATARDALLAAVDAQRALAGQIGSGAPAGAGPVTSLRVRMGIHSGEALARVDGDYEGYLTLVRVQRISAAAHGEQILVSQASADLLNASPLPEAISLLAVGEHRLKGLPGTERLYQVAAPGRRVEFPPLATLVAHPHNLPVELTSFIGREKEQSTVRRLLTATPARLLTLTGVGGTGKTRLAARTALTLLDEYPDGIWFVSLAPLADAAHVPHAVAAVLGVREEARRDVRETLTDHLRDRTLLLILDNCEHVIGACAELADSLMRHCLRMRIVATSREPLGIEGETIWSVPSLALPPVDATMSDVLASESGRLFVERAGAANRGFELSPQNARAVAQICRRLDGIPLALELASARAKALSVEQIATRLDDRFRLLTGGSRTALPRQRTLQALIDWSHDLLGEPERRFFRRLAVFAGGWTLEAAEAVCGDDQTDVLDNLASLVNKSLVQFDEAAGRYLLLETIRQYAGDRLVEAGEGDAVRDRHLAHMVAITRDSVLRASGPAAEALIARFAVERDNLRVALAWAFGMRADGETGARIAVELWAYWLNFGLLHEAREWLSQANRAVAGDCELRARVLTYEGAIAWQQGDYVFARANCEEAVRMCDTAGCRDQVRADSWHILGHVRFDQREYEAAREAFTASAALFRTLADRANLAVLSSDLGMVAYHRGQLDEAERIFVETLAAVRAQQTEYAVADVLTRLGDVVRMRGDLGRAEALYAESLEVAQRLGTKLDIAQALHKTAYLLIHRGETAEAGNRLRESMRLQHAAGNRQGIAECLGALACVALADGEVARSVRLFAAQDGLLEQIGAPLAPADRAEVERDTADARTRLDKGEFDTEWNAGRTLPIEAAVAFALVLPDGH